MFSEREVSRGSFSFVFSTSPSFCDAPLTFFLERGSSGSFPRRAQSQFCVLTTLSLSTVGLWVRKTPRRDSNPRLKGQKVSRGYQRSHRGDLVLGASHEKPPVPKKDLLLISRTCQDPCDRTIVKNTLALERVQSFDLQGSELMSLVPLGSEMQQTSPKRRFLRFSPNLCPERLWRTVPRWDDYMSPQGF